MPVAEVYTAARAVEWLIRYTAARAVEWLIREEAVMALQADRALCDAVGAAFCTEVIRLKRAEWDAFNLQVSDWELHRYADAF